MLLITPRSEIESDGKGEKTLMESRRNLMMSSCVIQQNWRLFLCVVVVVVAVVSETTAFRGCLLFVIGFV